MDLGTKCFVGELRPRTIGALNDAVESVDVTLLRAKTIGTAQNQVESITVSGFVYSQNLAEHDRRIRVLESKMEVLSRAPRLSAAVKNNLAS